MAITSKRCTKCVKIVNENSDNPGVFLNPFVANALHVCDGGKAKDLAVNNIRSAVKNSSPSFVEIPSFLFLKVQALKNLGISIEVDSQNDFYPYMAEDMANKAGSNNPKDFLAAAENQITANKCTAFTMISDIYVGLKGGSPFDELHELLHVCSGKGGESVERQEMGNQTNEGTINYFSEKVALACSVPLSTRYILQTNIIKRLMALANQEGMRQEAFKALFGMTFKGMVADFFNVIGKAYVHMKILPNGKPKSFSEKNWTTEQAGHEFKSKLMAWNTKWVEDRTPLQ